MKKDLYARAKERIIKEYGNPSMIWCHEIDKWVTIEEYTDYYYQN
jgi:hypothetical protein